ncbi:acyltransferase [Hymenobacter sp. 5317J-9]|uniref:acyltransferase family protein n=1 Tax=Hymenobacter sp. 5317J-9 TaxID=2932250 RepID=UPI001FD6B046|nr:acyltransferase [Hymenobacter sp. 5317J-9]UOQ97086.1 acyltransferase [Hymenobacter sp. 5317J-9]
MAPSLAATGQSAGYFPALTGIRAIAAYMVYLHHFNPFTSFSLEKNTLGYYAFAKCRELHIGVTVFFCLSGFLIAYRYLNRIEFSSRWFFTYFRNRFARIYPMYFLLTVLVFGLWFYDHHSPYVGPFNAFTSTKEALLILGLNVTFLRGFSDVIKFSGVAQGWSLTVEETFYFLAPFILWWAAVDKKRLWLLLPVFAIMGLLFVKVFEYRPMLGVMGTYKFMWSYTFFGRCFEFLGGIFLALLLKAAPLPIRKRGVFTGIGAILILVGVALLVSFQETFPRVVINNVFLAVAILLFFYGLLTEQGAMRRGLASAPMQLLGKSSYVFYLIHVGAISLWLEHVLPPSYIGQFLALNGVAILLYKFMEEPINEFIRKKLTFR